MSGESKFLYVFVERLVAAFSMLTRAHSFPARFRAPTG